MTAGGHRIRSAIERSVASGRPALVPFITAGYPEPARFVDDLFAVAEAGDVVEVGVPFSNPLADGPTIQRSNRVAIASGVSLRWILERLAEAGDIGAPVVLMSYVNPLFRYGFDAAAADAKAAGVDGFIVSDLPWEASDALRFAMDRHGLAWIPLVTPATPDERTGRLCADGAGFVYAVTVKGTTGGSGSLPEDIGDYLARVRARAGGLPVCAGFGIRDAAQVRAIGRYADGAVVGSAVVEEIEAGRDPAVFLQSLRR